MDRFEPVDSQDIKTGLKCRLMNMRYLEHTQSIYCAWSNLDNQIDYESLLKLRGNRETVEVDYINKELARLVKRVGGSGKGCSKRVWYVLVRRDPKSGKY